MIQLWLFDILAIVFDTFAPSHIIRHLASISIAQSCDSYLFPRITISPSSIMLSIISGLAAAISILPLSNISLSSPVITLPSRVPTILAKLVLAFDKTLLSNVSKYDFAISSIDTSPVNFFPSVIGSVTTFRVSMSFHALRTEISLSIPSICLISMFITCGRTSLMYSGALTPNLLSTKCVSSLRCPALLGT